MRTWRRRPACQEARRARLDATRRLHEAYAREQLVAEVAQRAQQVARDLVDTVREIDARWPRHA